MKKLLIGLLVFALGFSLSAGIVLAKKGGQKPTENIPEKAQMGNGENCEAAPAVATQLLEEAGVDARYGEGRDGGNYVSDVARHMGPKTEFEGVDKCSVEDYKIEVAKFLIDQGAEDVADLFEVEAELESVEYEGMCSTFGTQEGDIITFTFSNKIEKEGDIIINFDGYQDFKESWGKADYEVDENLLTVTITEKWGNPRPEVGASVVGTENIKDVFGNDVVVPEGGVEVEGEPEGVGVISADYSSADFTDNEDGTGIMSITVKDKFENGVEELGMDDFSIIPPSGTEATLNQLDGYNSWDVSLVEENEGNYTVSLDYNNSPYDKDWTIKAGDEVINEALNINITD